MRSVTALFGFAVFVLSSCGGAPPKPTTPAPSKASTKTSDAERATPRARLSRALRELPPVAPVADAIPSTVRPRLKQLAEALPAETRTALASAAGGAQRPLLHLLLGGDAPAALLALATTPIGAEELRGGASNPDDPELIEGARELATRAASQFLRQRGADVASEALSVDLCLAIDRAARTLRRTDLQLLARRVAAELEPTAERWLQVARAAAWELDAELAESALAKVSEAKGPSRSGALAEVTELIGQVRVARGVEQGAALGPTLQGARALVNLGQYSRAAKLLAPHEGLAKKHLELSVTLSLTQLEGSTCPSLPPGVGNEVTCGVGWETNPRVAAAIERMHAAWQGGEGRTPFAVESYLGLGHVVPWSFKLVRPPGNSREEVVTLFRKNLTALRAISEQATLASPRLEGVALFIDVLAAAFEAAVTRDPARRIVLPPPTQRSLVARAEQLMRKSPDERLSHGAVLAVAATLAQERDSTPLLDSLPRMDDQDERLRQVLRLWFGLGNRRSAVVADARDQIAQLLPNEDDAPLERARLVLLMAEGEVIEKPTERSLSLLEHATRVLLEGQAPLDLKLRAALDRVGVLALSGRHSDAAELMGQLIPQVGAVPPGSTEEDLLTLSRVNLLGLRAAVSAGDERKEYRAKLEGALQGVEEPPASLRLIHRLWVRETLGLIDSERCGQTTPCKVKSAQKYEVSAKEIDDALGLESGKLLRSGAIPAGTLKLSFSYSSLRGIEPMVQFEPRLLVIEVPAVVRR